ncbi:MAG: DUF721 domain-containing protein [Pseudomonadota bacterium]
MVKKKISADPPTLLAMVLPSVLKGIRKDVDTGLLQVWEIWRTVVGAAIADNAQPAAFKGDMLIVNVANSVWCHHLQFLKSDVLRQLNQALGQDCIRDIKFKIGTWSDAGRSK